MRISEVLSLNRKDINWKKKKPKSPGRGIKNERYFSPAGHCIGSGGIWKSAMICVKRFL
jgi:hypothetical protein